MIDSAPIGIFDSGLGGLTVAKKVLTTFPNESIAYLGDEENIPYGEKSPEEICKFAVGICAFLIQRGAKIIVMACNMSSATALSAAKSIFPKIPIIGMIEAGARAATRCSVEKPIGILATTGTVKTKAYTRTIQRLAPEATVVEQACPKFVPLVESGMWNSDEAVEAATEYTESLLAAGCGSIVLGCTHYPYLRDVIQDIVGPDIKIIDPAEETTAEIGNILSEGGMLNGEDVDTRHAFYTSKGGIGFADLGGRFLGQDIGSVQQLKWGVDLHCYTGEPAKVGDRC